jgi:hypothetical protein
LFCIREGQPLPHSHHHQGPRNFGGNSFNQKLTVLVFFYKSKAIGDKPLPVLKLFLISLPFLAAKDIWSMFRGRPAYFILSLWLLNFTCREIVRGDKRWLPFLTTCIHIACFDLIQQSAQNFLKVSPELSCSFFLITNTICKQLANGIACSTFPRGFWGWCFPQRHIYWPKFKWLFREWVKRFIKIKVLAIT